MTRTGLSLAEVREIEFPPWVDRRAALRKLSTPTWETHGSYRRDITYKSPLLFSIVYMGRRLRQQDTGLVSFSRLHLDLCKAARRWADRGPCRDAWVAPRESGKSAWMFGILPLWALAHGHRSMFLAFSYVGQQSRGHLKNILNQLHTNDVLLADFPGLAPRRGQASVERTVLTNGATLASYGMQGTSLGIQSADGGRPDLIVGDDLEPGEADNSLDEVEKNRSRLLRNILPMNTRAVVQVTGTVTRHDSLVHGFVHAAKGRRQGAWVRAQGFEPHYYPALNEAGESLWPQRWPARELAEMRAADPHGYALNYDNDPQPPKDMTYWTPEGFQYNERFPVAQRVLHLDVAVTTSGTSDYTVLALAAVDASRQRALVERVEWGRWTAPQIRAKIHEFCEPLRIKPLVRVEANQGGNTWLDSLAPWPVGVAYETTRPGAPKSVRIRRAHARYAARAVWHPWPLPELQEELCRYPRGKHDDVPDAIAGALEWVFPVAVA